MIFNLSDFNSHWQTKKLEQLGTFKRGKSKHRPRNDKKLFENGSYPLIQTGEVKKSSLFIDKHTQTYNEFGLKQSKLWDKNTLCITIAANIAETAILKYPMCFPDSIVGFNAYENESSELFMHYVFTYIKKSIQNSASGSIQDNINIDYLTKLKFKIPEKKYQDRIVDILYSIDSKIELNNKINKELEAMAKMLYDYWFVQFDFPNENGKPYKSSGGKMVYNQELKREIPDGWEVKKLKELLINCTDGISNLKLNTEDKYTPIDYLPMKRMSFGDYLPSSEANSSLIQYKAKDILIGAMRVYFHRVCIAPFDGITRTTSLVLRPMSEKHLPYLYQVCNEEKTISVATKLSSGTQQPYVNWEKSLENYKIAYPNNILLIDKYSNKINNIINQVILNEQQNQELAKLRDWLLPMLMNGQVSVK